MKTVAASLCFLLLTLLCFEAAGGDKDQDKKKRSYASAAADCDKAISGRKSELAESYSSEVWTLKQRFQKDGDLEKALAADKEWSRSIRREPLKPDDLVESPKELRLLQDTYIDLQDRVEQEVAADVVRELEREAKEVAQAGNLTDGRVLQQEIDKIKRLYLSDTTANAERSSTAKGEKVAGKNNPEDPIAACDEMIRQKRVALQAQYVGELVAMEKSFQVQGLLEDLFAAKAEQKRYVETPILAEANIVETPEPLRELQQKYLELHESLVTSTANDFIARLEEQKKSLTIEGNLEGAMQAKNNAEKIRRNYSSAEMSGEHLPGQIKGTRSVFLSDLEEQNANVTAGGVWRFGKNGNLSDPFGSRIAVKGNTSKKGLSTAPGNNGQPSSVTYAVPAGCSRLVGIAAINDTAIEQQTPVVFEVIQQDRVLWQSQPIRGAGKSQSFSVSLKGSGPVTLRTRCSGFNHDAHAVWVDPKFMAK